MDDDLVLACLHRALALLACKHARCRSMGGPVLSFENAPALNLCKGLGLLSLGLVLALASLLLLLLLLLSLHVDMKNPANFPTNLCCAAELLAFRDAHGGQKLSCRWMIPHKQPPLLVSPFFSRYDCGGGRRTTKKVAFRDFDQRHPPLEMVVLTYGSRHGRVRHWKDYSSRRVSPPG